jgi:hypothetical protein
MLCKHRFPCNTLTHPINEDLLNIKRKGDPEVAYPLSYVHQKVSKFFGPRYIGEDLSLGPNLDSFNRAVVPLMELSFLRTRLPTI